VTALTPLRAALTRLDETLKYCQGDFTDGAVIQEMRFVMDAARKLANPALCESRAPLAPFPLNTDGGGWTYSVPFLRKIAETVRVVDGEAGPSLEEIEDVLKFVAALASPAPEPDHQLSPEAEAEIARYRAYLNGKAPQRTGPPITVAEAREQIEQYELAMASLATRNAEDGDEVTGFVAQQATRHVMSILRRVPEWWPTASAPAGAPDNDGAAQTFDLMVALKKALRKPEEPSQPIVPNEPAGAGQAE
jgi:hypothetical protein